MTTSDNNQPPEVTREMLNYFVEDNSQIFELDKDQIAKLTDVEIAQTISNKIDKIKNNLAEIAVNGSSNAEADVRIHVITAQRFIHMLNDFVVDNQVNFKSDHKTPENADSKISHKELVEEYSQMTEYVKNIDLAKEAEAVVEAAIYELSNNGNGKVLQAVEDMQEILFDEGNSAVLVSSERAELHATSGVTKGPKVGEEIAIFADVDVVGDDKPEKIDITSIKRVGPIISVTDENGKLTGQKHFEDTKDAMRDLVNQAVDRINSDSSTIDNIDNELISSLNDMGVILQTVPENGEYTVSNYGIAAEAPAQASIKK